MESELEQETTRRSFLSSIKANGVQLCMQTVQVCIGVVILTLGLLVGGAGLWALLSQKDLIVISDGDPQLTKLPLSMIVAGIIVALLGLVGVIGGLFVHTVSGRILIGVYGFVLVLLIINEIGIGASAVVFQEDLRTVFIESAERSLMHYGNPNYTSVTKHWDLFQRKYFCCGAVNFTSYQSVFMNNTVPASCCQSYLDEADCRSARLNATRGSSNKLYLKGCPGVVMNTLKQHDLDFAVVVIVFAAVQLMGVVLAGFLAYASSKAKKKTAYSYKLIQARA